MRQPKTSLAAVAVSLALLVGACGGESPVEPAATPDTPADTPTLKTDQIVDVHSATLHIYVTRTNLAPAHIYRVTDDWDEAAVTHGSFADRYDPTILGSFMVDELGYRTVDLTYLVAGWALDEFPNHGLLIDQDVDGTPWAAYHSREAGSFPPLLEVCYETVEDGIVCLTVEAVADAAIDGALPDQPRGDDVALYTGWVESTEHERQALVSFALPQIPDDPDDPGEPAGCTRSPGYWKTHSERGPAPYDAAWALLPDGAASTFFLSARTYHQVLWTPPAGGHAYYILAFQYIAAELNRLAGADFAAVQAAFAAATDVFANHTPDEVKAFTRSRRAELLGWAETLDDYNNGLIGPGHCDD